MRGNPQMFNGLMQSILTRGRVSVQTYCAPEGIRTPNLLIRSQMLYPLSYGRLKRVNPTCFLYATQTFRKPFIALFYARISYQKDTIAFAVTTVNSGSYFFN